MNSYTTVIEEGDVEKLRSILSARGFAFSEKAYAYYSAKKEKLHVTVYEKGPKVLVQGKQTEEFVKFILEPEILGEALLGNEEVYMPEMFEPHFGVDESGKGDFFGPLVIAGVYTERESARALLDAGIADSKRVSSQKKIVELSEKIRSTPGVVWECISLRPEKYNELYVKFGNLNRLLAWGHARVIAALAAKVPQCPRALSDQFAREEVLLSAMKYQGAAVEHIELQQRTKGESDIAVAAASIIAREAFVDWVERASEKGGVTMPLGAGSSVLDAGRELVGRHGREILPKIAKMHFKTAMQI
ncbi:ribonuclease HIII [Rubritalea tangerina]|uniref:Ribonuclease n=2 Tax=Rubritalea tangerina TaxID=430798 RepID=A0ABW4ZCR5_9BACT